jgi:hypothetical protein
LALSLPGLLPARRQVPLKGKAVLIEKTTNLNGLVEELIEAFSPFQGEMPIGRGVNKLE